MASAIRFVVPISELGLAGVYVEPHGAIDLGKSAATRSRRNCWLATPICFSAESDRLSAAQADFSHGHRRVALARSVSAVGTNPPDQQLGYKEF
jgi:hypothetical protein